MSILLTQEIKDKLEESILSAETSLFVITAYAKEETVKWISSLVDHKTIERRIILRSRVGDYLNGASDLSVLKYCLLNGWQTYIDTNLHAKVFVIDDEEAIISSSNLTQRGLGFSEESNLEIGVITRLSKDDIEKIHEVFDSSCQVDQELLEDMTRVIENLLSEKIIDPHSTLDWPFEIKNRLNTQSTVLFINDLPECKDSISSDGEEYGFIPCKRSDEYSTIKRNFKSSKIYKWLISILEEKDSCFFGELTQILHESILCESIYRSEVKTRLNNLLGWVNEFCSDEVDIDVPYHSKRVTLKRT